MSMIGPIRPLPVYLVKCFSSRIKDKIERCLAMAFAEGYTRQEILEGSKLFHSQVSRN